MGLTLVTGPAADPVSIFDVRQHLKIDGAGEDATLYRYLTAARLHVEGRDGRLERALITQTWDWTLDDFPCGPDQTLRVPLPPLQSITSVKYIDTGGVEQTLASSEYSVDIRSSRGRLRPAYEKTWPSTRAVMNAVTVRFVAGYGAGPAAIPEPIRQALLGLVADFYTNRDATGAPPAWIEALLAPYAPLAVD